MRIRNLIVHNYDKIDGAVVVGLLKKNLSDYDGFKAAIAALLESENQGTQRTPGKKKQAGKGEG